MQRTYPALILDDIGDAWWKMILKGTVWKYSVQPHCPPDYAPLPSHFFRTKFRSTSYNTPKHGYEKAWTRILVLYLLSNGPISIIAAISGALSV